jgi:hypothetical protein
MFPQSYFAGSYFTGSYFSKIGALATTVNAGFEEALLAYLKSSSLADAVGAKNIGFNGLPPASDLGIVLEIITATPEENSTDDTGSYLYTDQIEFQVAIYQPDRSQAINLARRVVATLNDASFQFLDGTLTHCRRGIQMGVTLDPDLGTKGQRIYQAVIMFTAVVQRHF